MEDSKKSYSKISKEVREVIINKILNEKKTPLEVAQEHQILESTCKSIMNTYLKEGRVGKKESRVRKSKKVIRTYEIFINPINPFLSTCKSFQTVENNIEIPIKKQKNQENDPSNHQQQQPNPNNYNMFLYWCDQLQKSMENKGFNQQNYQNFYPCAQNFQNYYQN